MIYLVGTYHELQHTGTIWKERTALKDVERARRDFQSYLREKVLELKPALVAEELSHDLLTYVKGGSIAGDVAEELGIEHRLCDPGCEERERLGIPGKADDLTEPAREQQFEIRERYWLRLLQKHDRQRAEPSACRLRACCAWVTRSCGYCFPGPVGRAAIDVTIRHKPTVDRYELAFLRLTGLKVLNQASHL